MWHNFDARYEHYVSETSNTMMARHPGKDINFDQVSNNTLAYVLLNITDLHYKWLNIKDGDHQPISIISYKCWYD